MGRMKKDHRSVPEDISMAPATTTEARENQMIALATNLAEQQLRDGTASSQIITHYLKLATRREELELQRLEKEIELATAKTEALESTQRIEALYADALKAMSSYSGHDKDEDEDIQ